jgi:hypothetical protein
MTYPVALKVDYPEKLSRITTFLRIFTVIPAAVVLAIVSIAGYIMYVLSWFAILFTGKYPESFFKFVAYWYRWALRVGAYVFLLTDKYPPFNGEDQVEYPVRVAVERPTEVSRLITLLRIPMGSSIGYTFPQAWRFTASWFPGFPMAFPHEVILSFLYIAVGVLVFVSWWAILFTGRYPKSMFDFVVWVFRWNARVTGYTYFFTDEYPPFSGAE